MQNPRRAKAVQNLQANLQLKRHFPLSLRQTARLFVPSPAQYRRVNNTCRYALEHNPIPPDAANNELTRQSPIVVERLNHIGPGQNAFTANLPPHLQ